MITVNELRTRVFKEAWEMKRKSTGLGRKEKTFAECLTWCWSLIKSRTNYMNKADYAEYLAKEEAAKAEKERQEAEAKKAFEGNKASSTTFTVAEWFTRKNMILVPRNSVFTMVKETTKALLLELEGTSVQFWAPKSVCTASMEQTQDYLKAIVM